MAGKIEKLEIQNVINVNKFNSYFNEKTDNLLCGLTINLYLYSVKRKQVKHINR